MNTIRKQSGFTLIELMIVVAIIGILAAIALPAYQNYTARAQASEALTATAGVRADLAVIFAEEGDFPATGSEAHNDIGDLDGRYFSLAALGNGDGIISVTFDDGANATQVMTITPSATGGQITGWTCAGLTPVSRIPSGCR